MLSVSQRLDRLAARLRELALWVERDALSLTEPWHAEWEGGEGALRVGDPWPTLEGVVHFSYPQVSVPPEWPLEETYFDLNVGGESLLTLRYEGEEERFGVTPHHERFPLLARAFSIHTESVARFEFGVPNPQPRLERARLVLIDEPLESLHRLLTLVFETGQSLPDHEVVPPLLEAAERTLMRLEWPSRTDDYVARTVNRMGTLPIWRAPDLKARPEGLDDAARETVREARAWLEQQLALLRERYPKVGTLTLTGHAHLDLAWLWPASETRRKGRRTLYGMLALMRRYPEFRFNQSSAQLFTWLEEDDPAPFHKASGRRGGGGSRARRGDVARARRQHARGRVAGEATFVRPAFLQVALRVLPRHRLAPRHLWFHARAAATFKTGGRDELFYPQAQLVRAERFSPRPLLVGGPRRLARARALVR